MAFLGRVERGRVERGWSRLSGAILLVKKGKERANVHKKVLHSIDTDNIAWVDIKSEW